MNLDERTQILAACPTQLATTAAASTLWVRYFLEAWSPREAAHAAVVGVTRALEVLDPKKRSRGRRAKLARCAHYFAPDSHMLWADIHDLYDGGAAEDADGIDVAIALAIDAIRIDAERKLRETLGANEAITVKWSAMALASATQAIAQSRQPRAVEESVTAFSPVAARAPVHEVDRAGPRPTTWKRGESVVGLLRAMRTNPAGAEPFGAEIDAYVAQLTSPSRLINILLATGGATTRDVARVLLEQAKPCIPKRGVARQMATTLRAVLRGDAPPEEALFLFSATVGNRAWKRDELGEEEVLMEALAWIGFSLGERGDLGQAAARLHQYLASLEVDDPYRRDREAEGRHERVACDRLRAAFVVGDHFVPGPERAADEPGSKASYDPRSGAWGRLLRMGLPIDEVRLVRDRKWTMAKWYRSSASPAALLIYLAQSGRCEMPGVLQALTEPLLQHLPPEARVTRMAAANLTGTYAERGARALGTLLEAIDLADAIARDERAPRKQRFIVFHVAEACALVVLATLVTPDKMELLLRQWSARMTQAIVLTRGAFLTEADRVTTEDVERAEAHLAALVRDRVPP